MSMQGIRPQSSFSSFSAAMSNSFKRSLKHVFKAFLLATTRNPGVNITFTGGFGAQIISSSIYHFLRQNNFNVFAEFSYFAQDTHINPGNSCDGLSQFPWQLDAFDISCEQFRSSTLSPFRALTIEDGSIKQSLFLKSMMHAPTVKFFREKIDNYNSIGCHSASFSSGYTCVHMRRGDYLSVSSHVVSDETYISFLSTNLVDKALPLVILSDSPISDWFISRVKLLGFDQVHSIVGDSPADAFKIMYASTILLCSNSQFSFAAGLLSKSATVFVPSKWFNYDTNLRHSSMAAQNLYQLDKTMQQGCSFSHWNGVLRDIQDANINCLLRSSLSF
ncbi:alpha-1,2-fucosyltransferase [Synechococcus sp. UW105]|uniref:alpha-1,2-fucosyltransferase n=1 Tax=Synechococcus sp. UW105 TaxID=337067 RepID=UPI001483391F|nr:alpha-1,2-fucosyltransferase [Synechococcus sp. UW105]